MDVSLQLPGYDAFILRLFFRAQYSANITPLINEITRMASAMPDIHVVAHVPTAGSVLCAKEIVFSKISLQKSFKLFNVQKSFDEISYFAVKQGQMLTLVAEK